MRKMKDSKIMYIGVIPENWEIGKVKEYYTLQTGFTPNTKNLNYYDKKGYTWVNISDLNINKFITNSKNKISQEYINKYKPNITPKGSLLYSFKLSVGQVAIAQNELYTNEAIASFINNDNINLNFLYYSSFMIAENANENIYGAKLLNQNLIKNAYIIFPPLNEQQKIADFLDKKVTEIDNVIKKTKETIEDYKKFKEIEITNVALSGLNNNEFVDTNIDWIGNIPKTWKVEKFKHILNERNEKNNPIKTEERLSLSIDKGVTLYAEKTTNLDRFKEDCSLYKLAYEGDLVFNSMNMIVGATGYSKYFGCVSPVYYTYYDLTPNHITTKYFEYVFKTKTVKKVLYSMGKGIMSIDRGDDKINTCRLKIARDDLRSFKVPVPPISEQKEIVNYLENKCKEIDTLIKKKENILEQLEQYKKSLIYEYVTGKKEVI